MDPLSITASAIAILGACRTIISVLSTVISEVNADDGAVLIALKTDIETLTADLDIVAKRCQQAGNFAGLYRIDDSLLRQISLENKRCHTTIFELRAALERAIGNNRLDENRLARRFIIIIVRLLKSPDVDVEALQKRIASHQQRLHFYMTLVSE